ncbi:MAG: hypothetical protein ACK4N5_02555 [Myxococcales bacterium]
MYRAAALGFLVLTGCAALADSHEFRYRPETFETRQIPDKPHEPCRLYIVDRVPDGAKRVGTVDVPAQTAQEGRVDPGSLGYACDLKATHAVKEEEFFDKRGKPYWKMSVYRVERSLF